MVVQEKHVAPTLGVVILLALVALDASASVRVFIGILGLIAVASWLLPHEVQVEVRVAIAVVGLLVLGFFVGPIALFVVLLALGAIGALQVRHADALAAPPLHTVEWLKAALERSGWSSAAASATNPGGPAGDTALAAATDPGEPGGDPAQASATGPGGGGGQHGAPQGFGGGSWMPSGQARPALASALAAVILLCLFALPFMTNSLPDETLNYTFQYAVEVLEEEARDDVASDVAEKSFWILVAVAVAALASVVLPRAAVSVIGVAGVAVSVLSFIWLYIQYGRLADYYGVTVTTLPSIGFLIVAGCFILITVLSRREA